MQKAEELASDRDGQGQESTRPQETTPPHDRRDFFFRGNGQGDHDEEPDRDDCSVRSGATELYSTYTGSEEEYGDEDEHLDDEDPDPMCFDFSGEGEEASEDEEEEEGGGEEEEEMDTEADESDEGEDTTEECYHSLSAQEDFYVGPDAEDSETSSVTVVQVDGNQQGAGVDMVRVAFGGKCPRWASGERHTRLDDQGIEGQDLKYAADTKAHQEATAEPESPDKIEAATGQYQHSDDEV